MTKIPGKKDCKIMLFVKLVVGGTVINKCSF